MDQNSQVNKVGGATYAVDTTPAASYALTPFLQSAPMASVPLSSAGNPFLPFSAPQGSVAYPSAMQLLSNLQQPQQQTDPFEGATNDAAYALTALTTYNHQPEALAAVPPSSSAGATFIPAPASQGAPTAYQAAIPSPLSSQQQAALLQKFHQQQQQQLQYQQQQLQAFWSGQLAEAEKATDLKVHNLPLARIKKIMRADEDVKMIAAEAPVIFAKACEMFILELTLRSWLHTEGAKRRTMQRSDVAAAIMANEMFDFLMDVTPEQQANGDGVPPPPPPPLPQTTAGQVPYPMHVPFPMYANQQPPFTWPTLEYQQQQQQQNPGAGQNE